MNFTKLPNFFLIGAAKAGTTSLYDILKQHPQVYLPFQKEPMFFSNDNNFNRGMEWYSHTFFQQAAVLPKPLNPRQLLEKIIEIGKKRFIK